RSYLAHFLASRGYAVECIGSGADVIAKLEGGTIPDLLVLDIVMPGMSGLDLLRQVRKLHPTVSVIMLSAVGQTRTVVEALRMGASDYVTKPVEEEELELAIEGAFEKRNLKAEVSSLRRRLDLYTERAEILSSNARMLRIKEIARHVADVDVPVLITGESGVGKEVVARYIHTQSKRHDRPFVKVNCAALPHDLLESELFGYDRGAFTGANVDKPGKFELAGTGCILLDEI